MPHARKPRPLPTLLLLLAGAGLGMMAAPAQEPQPVELRWGEFGPYGNWRRYGYGINSDYAFIGRLPDLREFPKLLDAARDPKMDSSDREIILSQMRTLSRCDFEMRAVKRGDDTEQLYQASVAKWQEWWERYGSKLPAALEERGQRFETVWKEIAPTPYLECPRYPIVLPQVWSATLSFQSGDYGGVTEEVIEFRVTEDRLSLQRRYRTGWKGKEKWTRETWQDFTRAEADHFLVSLIYAIDNPWFFADEELSDPEGNDEDEYRIGHILGRPEAWTDYYPSFDWTGILDDDQHVIINHDPRHWHSADYDLGPKTSISGGLGVVFPLIRDQFPDPSWEPDLSRWKRDDEADPEPQ